MTFILPSPFNTSSALDISLIRHLFSFKLQGVFSRVIVGNKMAAAREKSGEYTWCQLIWRATLFQIDLVQTLLLSVGKSRQCQSLGDHYNH